MFASPLRSIFLKKYFFSKNRFFDFFEKKTRIDFFSSKKIEIFVFFSTKKILVQIFLVERFLVENREFSKITNFLSKSKREFWSRNFSVFVRFFSARAHIFLNNFQSLYLHGQVEPYVHFWCVGTSTIGIFRLFRRHSIGFNRAL